jgi:hypothetical protein
MWKGTGPARYLDAWALPNRLLQAAAAGIAARRTAFVNDKNGVRE